MYLLLGFEIEHFPEFPSDVEFCNGKLKFSASSQLQSSLFLPYLALVQEQNLFCIPGASFSIDNHMRLVLAAPSNVLQDACDRLREFCAKHYVA